MRRKNHGGRILALAGALACILSACGEGAPASKEAVAGTVTGVSGINQVLCDYHRVLSGGLSVQPVQPGGPGFTALDVFSESGASNAFCLYDVDGDGVPELHLSAPKTYCIITWAASGPYALYYGPGYTTLLNNGALLYERPGEDPANIRYTYTWFTDGGGSVAFEQWDEDGDGYTQEDTYRIEGQSVSQDEYLRRTQAYLFQDSDGPLWVLFGSVQ